MGKSQSKSKSRSSEGEVTTYSERRVVTKTTRTTTVTNADGSTSTRVVTESSYDEGGSGKPKKGGRKFFSKKKSDKGPKVKREKKRKEPKERGGATIVKDVKPDSTFLKNLRQDMLKHHNKLRSKHGSPALKLDNSLNKVAQDWAEQMAKSDRFGHRPNNQNGENIYYAMNSRGLGTVTGEGVVQSWYDEVKKYNFSRGGFSSGTGHFTQVVWKNSKTLGVGFAPSKNKANTWYVVGNYSPAGNVQGQYEQNVKPAK
ncbi:Golgi-associated plant pathogenesis-related protein 1-like [Ptychodera flava]|uniref:Golgi-associated plant pathogenesis-related protein 1-like n=1 Tax=Ptychodera flava TaxID=63121 RepID=UPI00396A3D98